MEQRIAERHRLAADRRDARRLRDHRPVRKGPVVRTDRQVGVAVKRCQDPALRSVDRKPLQLDDVADLQLGRIVDRQRAGELLARYPGREHRIANILCPVVGDRPAALGRDKDHPARPRIFGEEIVDIMLGLDLLLLFAHQIFAQLVIIVALVDELERAREPELAAAGAIARAVEDDVAARNTQYFGDLRPPFREAQRHFALHRIGGGERAEHRLAIVEPVVGDRAMIGHFDDRPGIGGDRREAEAITRIGKIGQRVRRHRRGVRQDLGQFPRLRLNRKNQRRTQRHNRNETRTPFTQDHHSSTPCGPVTWRRATAAAMSGTPFRTSRARRPRNAARTRHSC